MALDAGVALATRNLETPMRLSLVPAVVVGTALVLTGCSGGSDEPEPTEPTTTASEEPTEEPTEEEEAEPDASAQECLVGGWTSDPAAGADVIAESMGLPEKPQIDVTGESWMTFAEDGTVTTSYAGVTTTMIMAVEGSSLEVRSAMDGELVGSWAVGADGTLAITDVDPSGVTMTTQTTVDGEVVDVPGMQDQQTGALAAGGEFRFTCGEAELRLVPQLGGEDAIADFEQVLTRR